MRYSIHALGGDSHFAMDFGVVIKVCSIYEQELVNLEVTNTKLKLYDD